MTGHSGDRPPSDHRKAGLVRRAMRKAGWIVPNGFTAVGLRDMKSGYHLIRTLWRDVREQRRISGANSRARQAIDFLAEGASLGLEPSETELQISMRLAETRRLALLSLSLAAAVFLCWAYEMLFPARNGDWFLVSLEFLPFSAAALAFAFQNAWINWQLRTGRRGTAADYLTTNDGFWPSLNA